MFDKELYIRRRERLKKQVSKGLIILLGNHESSINFKDNIYPFRQDSSFLYFFGIDRPDLNALIDVENDIEIVFGEDPSIDQMVFMGEKRLLESQCKRVGIDKVSPPNSFKDYIKKFKGDVHFLPPYRPESLMLLNDCLSIPHDQILGNSSEKFIKAVVAQRSIKSSEEIEEIEKAVNLTIDMQLLANSYQRVGLKEAQIAAKIEEIVHDVDCQTSFPTILTVEGHVLHNHYKGNTLKSGDMLLVDCGVETKMHYAGDLTRTFPVGKSFTSRQKEIYQIVQKAHDAAVNMLKPGIRFLDTHLTACEVIVEGLKSIGLMKGDAKEAVQAGAHTMFFQCGLGHMMGLDVHDMEDLGEQYVGYTDELAQSKEFGFKSLRLGRPVETGFVVTIEPGIYIIPYLIDLWKAEKKYSDFIDYQKLETYRDFTGIRIENDFLVTENGNRQLGKELPYHI